VLVTETFLSVMLASSLAALVTALGILATQHYAHRMRVYGVYFKSFAAGMLTALTMTHLIPESFEMRSGAPAFLLAGFLVLYLANHFINLYVCQMTEIQDAGSIVTTLGIGFHSLVDGVIYAVTFNISIFTGVLAAIGMVLHEFPEGVVTFSILDRAGFSRRKAVLYALLAAAFSTPLGTLVAYPFIRRIQPTTLGALLALSAGALIYAGASHLLPEVEHEDKPYTLLAMFAGVGLAVVIVTLRK
jgi:zinc transporter ZupT